MKVLITTDCFTPTINGVVTSVINLKDELSKLGHEVKILTLSETIQSFEKDGIISIGSLGVGKIYPGARLSLIRHNKCIEDVAAWHPDIIHAQSEFGTSLIAHNLANRLNVPLVHTYHTIYEDYTHYFSPIEKWGKAMAALFTRVTLKDSNCIIAPTEKVRMILSRYGIKQEIIVVPTGINLKKYNDQITDTKRDILKEKIGISKENKVLLVVGRLAKEKNIEEILLFLSKLKMQKTTLLILGDGPYREALYRQAKQLRILDKVVFAGMIQHERLREYYQLGDVFISASNSETQGLTYIEALANGVPILCRKDPCLVNVLKEGINGWQYESFDEFKEKLEELLRQKRNDMSKTLIMDGLKEYSSVSFGKNVEQLYINTLKDVRIKA